MIVLKKQQTNATNIELSWESSINPNNSYYKVFSNTKGTFKIVSNFLQLRTFKLNYILNPEVKYTFIVESSDGFYSNNLTLVNSTVPNKPINLSNNNNFTSGV
jgi:hypothetical protein